MVDQTNPLSQLTHERRLSALGAGRPESQAGRLRGARRPYLALWPHLPDRDAGRHQHRPDLALVDLRRRGRVRLPDHAVPHGRRKRKLTERRRVAAGRRGIAGPPGARRHARPTARRSRRTRVIARFGGDFSYVGAEQVQYIDISPKQMVGVSAGPDSVPGARRRQPGARWVPTCSGRRCRCW